MRDKHYKNRNIRLDDDVWKQFKEEWEKSGLSWNQYIKQLLKEKYEN